MLISIQQNFPEVARALNTLHADIRDRALASAVNKTLDQALTLMARTIASEFNVKVSYVRERLRIRRATSKGGVQVEGALTGTGKRPGQRSANVIAFLEKKVTLAEGRRRRAAGTLNQLFVKIKRTGPAKPIPGAFIGNKGRTVFRRVGKARLPIEPVQVIDIPQMFTTRRINDVVVRTLLDRFPAIFEREAKFYVDRFNRTGYR